LDVNYLVISIFPHIFSLLGNREPQLASHVLQLVFLGDTGYRFAFAHFPTKEANASELYVVFWEAVLQLEKWDFKVRQTFMSLMIYIGSPIESRLGNS
jgi:hypothetical protein